VIESVCSASMEGGFPATGPASRTYTPVKFLLLLLLLHDLYSTNFEDRVRGAGIARWRT